MKYMLSEWTGRLNHWMHTLESDLYLPLGELAMEGYLYRETPDARTGAERALFFPSRREHIGGTVSPMLGFARRLRCRRRRRDNGL